MKENSTKSSVNEYMEEVICMLEKTYKRNIKNS